MSIPDEVGGARIVCAYCGYVLSQCVCNRPVKLKNPPKRKYGPLEVHDPERRTAATVALNNLWNALDLSDPPRIAVDRTDAEYEAHYQAWKYLANLLLGDDCPEHGINT